MRLLAWMLCALAVAGCSKDEKHSAAAPDGAADAGGEVAAPDAATDTGPADVTTDSGPPDALPEAGPPDVVPDAADAGPPEAAPDVPALSCQRTTYALTDVASVLGVPEAVTASEAGVSGDESAVPYKLPWSFPLFGKDYTDIVADTNANTWLAAAAQPESVFDLAAGGAQMLPVIAAWNDDLDSDSYGTGVEIQSMTVPDRVVLHWNTETHNDWDYQYLNDLTVVLHPNGYVLVSYELFETTRCDDNGSGFSAANGTDVVSITSLFGDACSLAGTRLLLEPPCTADDPDDDGLTSTDEAAAGTDPLVADTDGDGAKDGWEVLVAGTDPTT